MTRQLAAWAGLLAVPTAVAGIYGMNFEYIPELKWHYGYFFVWGVILTICGGLYWRFRRIGWL
ncbi:CorA-like Mg2+ transporter protein [Novosphingobium sp. GV055]|nr:CorA-like Mg2+ transporter protein [Novosphingobium sp. GV055]PUB00032.1 CorA-like Mg2+ transporter protein [Novosphingobium sp. GV061]PUB15002.1 CorA-like Mg2+ transporter protein [Novosphingobium sp. GV079]PUB39061.1 CorA-like Mg2+ transporter protein [Novosphingobium sp. GV027]